MALVTWDNSFSVNVREIDQQHQTLFNMLNQFYEQVGKNAKEALRTLLDSLVDYTKHHFASEEKYFARFKYPDAAFHTKAHQGFVQKVEDVRKRFIGGQLVLSTDLTTFLKEWLIQHIKGADKAYSKHFNENGLF